MHIIDILVNCPSIASADRISTALLEQRLVACSNRYAPIQSAYYWKGKVAQEQEYPLLLKTRRDLAQPVEDAIRALHPYEVPPNTPDQYRRREPGLSRMGLCRNTHALISQPRVVLGPARF